MGKRRGALAQPQERLNPRAQGGFKREGNKENTSNITPTN